MRYGAQETLCAKALYRLLSSVVNSGFRRPFRLKKDYAGAQNYVTFRWLDQRAFCRYILSI